MKCDRIQNFSGPYFPAIGLNTERYGAVRMLGNTDQKTTKYGQFSRKLTVYWLLFVSRLSSKLGFALLEHNFFIS